MRNLQLFESRCLNIICGFCSRCLQNFIIVLSSSSLTFRCGFLGICPAWTSLSFLNLQMEVFYLIGHNSVIVSSTVLSPLLLESKYMCVRLCDVVPRIPEDLFFFFLNFFSFCSSGVLISIAIPSSSLTLLSSQIFC